MVLNLKIFASVWDGASNDNVNTPDQLKQKNNGGAVDDDDHHHNALHDGDHGDHSDYGTGGDHTDNGDYADLYRK